MQRIYLDYNASTPVAPEVAAAMLPFLSDHHGNPSSAHWAAPAPKAALEKARAQVAALLGCAHDEVVFTSGGSEANNLALKGVYFARRDAGKEKFIVSTDDAQKYETFSVTHANEAKAAKAASHPVEITYKTTQYGRDIVALADATLEEPPL